MAQLYSRCLSAVKTLADFSRSVRSFLVSALSEGVCPSAGADGFLLFCPRVLNLICPLGLSVEWSDVPRFGTDPLHPGTRKGDTGFSEQAVDDLVDGTGFACKKVEMLTAGLSLIFLIVLLGPFVHRRIERNLEGFLFVMRAISATLSKAWSAELIHEGLTAFISITLAVLAAGALFCYLVSNLRLKGAWPKA